MNNEVIKSFNKIDYPDSEIEKYIKLAEDEEEELKKISGAVKTKLAINGVKKSYNIICNELKEGETIEKIIKTRNTTAIYATTIASIAGGTMGASMDYGIFDALYFTNKRLFFVDLNVANQPLKYRSKNLEEVLGIAFTNDVIKINSDKDGKPMLEIRMNRLKLFSIIWSCISIIGFFVARKLRMEELFAIFTLSGAVTIVYSILKSIQDKVSEKVQIAFKDGYILKVLVANDDYEECVKYLKEFMQKSNK